MDKDEITAAVREAIEQEFGHMKIDTEIHYKQHLWIKDMMEWTESIKSELWKTIVRTAVKTIIFLLFVGFGIWGAKNLLGK